MIIKEITASFSRTIQIEQYEPIRFHSSVTATLDEKDDRELCMAQLFEMVKKDVGLQEIEIKNKKKDKVDGQDF